MCSLGSTFVVRVSRRCWEFQVFSRLIPSFSSPTNKETWFLMMHRVRSRSEQASMYVRLMIIHFISNDAFVISKFTHNIAVEVKKGGKATNSKKKSWLRMLELVVFEWTTYIGFYRLVRWEWRRSLSQRDSMFLGSFFFGLSCNSHSTLNISFYDI